MIKEVELDIRPLRISDYDLQRELLAKELHLTDKEKFEYIVLRRSIDARKSPLYKVRYRVFINEPLRKDITELTYKTVDPNKRVIIVGSGPAGLFAALRLIEMGIKPIVLERGKDVRARRFDLKAIQRDHIVNPESNYCFGEGGAGTYSDGKLYTRSKKRGDVKRILDILIHHGASEIIAVDSHPHIGSNKLPKIIKNIRETIFDNGGEVRFNSKVTDFIIQENRVRGVVINNSEELLSENIILATGHSARDIFYNLKKNNIYIEAKPFAMGVRIEHPQEFIDYKQYKRDRKSVNLPAASYSLTCQIDKRGVYSFCMCPGGIIVPSATDKDELVLNGMSVSSRNSKFANSGFVVEVSESEFMKYSNHGPFAALEYQMEVERKCFIAGGKKQTAPAQKVSDFIKKRISSNLNKSSYIPGIVPAPLHEILPAEISNRMIEALKYFNKKMPGYAGENAQILAPESRTSSPVKIPRDNNTLEHIQVKGLYPCGEGAGYAGGIVSAAIDGEKCAEAISKKLL